MFTDNMEPIKDFLRLLFGMPEDEPISSTNLILGIAAIAFVLVMLFLISNEGI
jgi:hypothetical protein